MRRNKRQSEWETKETKTTRNKNKRKGRIEVEREGGRWRNTKVILERERGDEVKERKKWS